MVECAELIVPLDHDDAASRPVSLSVRRLRASDQEGRIGVLVTIAGGPGQRGTDLVTAETYAPGIADRFDIVGFDPRGTSGDTDISCIPEWDAYGDLDRTPDDAEEQRALDARTRALAEGCRDAHGDLLAHIGTADTVLDLEALRRALGEARISLFGSSYGSEVALRYASAFPGRTRAVVLDGYSDPNIPRAERDFEQALAFERQLDELLIECALRADCPIGGSDLPGMVLDRLLSELDEAPLPTSDGRVLTQTDAYEAITGALVGGPNDREALLAAIGEAADGDGRRLLHLADRIRRLFEASGIDLGTFMAIGCADTHHEWADRTAGDSAELTRRVLESAPRLGPWLWSPSAAEDLPLVGLCAMTPPETTSTPGPFDASGAGPVLVLAASGDPATPLSAARRATDDVEEAALLVVRADQHLVYPYAVAAPHSPAHRCVLDAVEAYLVGHVVPERGSCP